MPKKPYHIMLSGGGTGGHIFPAIAIADGLKKAFPDADFLFVGAKGRMEMEKVPQAGYPIIGLWISGIQRKLTISNLAFPFKLISSTIKARKIIRNFKPDVVIGTGGYASGPLLHAAAGKNIPTLILEQNSYPGLTNKWLSKTVDRICVAYPGMDKYFPKSKMIVTGSPIRKEIMLASGNKTEGCVFFGLNPELPTLLIIGGSQGARQINLAIASNLKKLLEGSIQILWQTGVNGFDEAQNQAKQLPNQDRVVITKFIQRMDLAYAAADVIVSRAGAIAIAEIVSVKKPAILIPLPSAAEDHQTQNALSLVKENAGILVKESTANEVLADQVLSLMNNNALRKNISQNLSHFDHKDATLAIVEQVKLLMKGGVE